MRTTTKPFLSLTAQDLMSREVVTIPREMSLRSAAHLLAQAEISGAPVVDAQGRCVGVLSATDILRWVEGEAPAAAPSFAQPSTVCSEWQVIDPEALPVEEVGSYMTADPVMVGLNTTIGVLAREMLDAHIHRLIVVDEHDRPIGVVSSTDLLAAIAYAERQHPEMQEMHPGARCW
jgi:CBS domain-containing protein